MAFLKHLAWYSFAGRVKIWKPNISLPCFSLLSYHLFTVSMQVNWRHLPTPVDGLGWTFYKVSCPNLESIVKSTLELVLEQNVTQAPGLLRLLLHDCFVQGCDGLILLNGTSSDPSEQQATPNLTLRAEAFEIISKIKEAVEANCGGVVSCADILALAASYAVFVVNSSKPKKFEMLYGRGFDQVDSEVSCKGYALRRSQWVGFIEMKELGALT